MTWSFYKNDNTYYFFFFVTFFLFSCRPVSAYALFFRDTQAAIKGQSPNASFGEVSKIVASMWDVLATEHKNVSTYLCIPTSLYEGILDDQK